MSNFVKFLQIAEDFKNKFKNCSNCSNDDLIAKSWKKALLIILLSSHVDEEIDLEKSLKLAIVQNLADCIDTQNSEYEPQKAKRKALKAFIRESLEDDTVYQLYKELQKNETLEAEFVNSLDGNFEETEPSWIKQETEEDTEEEDEDEDTEEEGDEEEIEEEAECEDECECECECEEDDKKDMSQVFEYLNKIAGVLKIDFRKKDKKHKDEKHKDKKHKDKEHKHKHKHEDKKHKDKYKD